MNALLWPHNAGKEHVVTGLAAVVAPSADDRPVPHQNSGALKAIKTVNARK